MYSHPSLSNPLIYCFLHNCFMIVIYYQLIMDLQEVKDIQSESKIVRQSKQHHLNAVYTPYQKSVQAVPYYARKKRELKSKNYALNKEDELERISSKLSVDLDTSKEIRTKRNFRNLAAGISVQPIVNDNKFTNFDPELYPLQEHEKVKVVDEKYFPLQNYYNYIQAVKSSEEIFRIAQQTKKKAQQGLFNFIGQMIDGDYDQSSKKGPIVKQTMKIKGFYESRFHPSSNIGRVREDEKEEANDELAPIHIQYQEDYEKNNPFCIKQAERVSILKGQAKQQPKYRY